MGELIITLLSALDEIPYEDYNARHKIASFLYIPDDDMSEHLEKLRRYLDIEKPTNKQRQDAGDLLEQIATLAFGSLRGVSTIKSFCSAGPQYDLLIGGDNENWLTLCNLLFMNVSQRDIVVEAKCTSAKVNDQQFARLCSIMESNLSNTAGLGVFFTLNGATGFPEKNGQRQNSLRASRLRQALYYAQTKKAIIVLDKTDILQLGKPASLIDIMMSRIRDLDHHSGLYIEACDSLVEIDLPSHLEASVSKVLQKTKQP